MQVWGAGLSRTSLSSRTCSVMHRACAHRRKVTRSITHSCGTFCGLLCHAVSCCVVQNRVLRPPQPTTAPVCRQQGEAGSGRRCELSVDDRDPFFSIKDGVRCQCRQERNWGGARATLGAFGGRVYYEVREGGRHSMLWCCCHDLSAVECLVVRGVECWRMEGMRKNEVDLQPPLPAARPARN